MYRYHRTSNQTGRPAPRSVGAVLSLAAVLALPACGTSGGASDEDTADDPPATSADDSSAASSGTDGESSTSTATDGSDPSTVPVAGDATLNVIHGSTPNQFDPCGTLNGSEVSYMWAVYATLLRSDPQTGELSPGIASDWQWSDDHLELRLPIREGLKFHDGTDVNADSVATSVNQCLELGNQDVEGLESVVADGSDVVFKLSTPTSGLPDLLGTRLGMIASPTARDELGNAFASQPVGAGPFTLESFTPGNSIALERWDDYVDAGTPAAKVARIEVQIITDPSAQVAALSGGDADYGFKLDPTVEPQLSEATGVTTHISEGVSVTDLNVDRTQDAMKDKRVRQAISYAIDRDAISEVATSGMTVSRSVQPYPPGHPFHFDELDDAYTYDPDKARELLAEAGYADGLELRGVSLDGQRYIDNGLVISDQLAEVGIEITFEAKALPDAVKAWYTDHEYDLMSTGMNSGPDWLTIYRRLLATNSAGNPGNVPIEGGDEVLAAINEAYDADKIEQALHDATVVFQEELPIIPLYHSPIFTAWSDRVVGGEDAYAINGESDFTALGITE